MTSVFSTSRKLFFLSPFQFGLFWVRFIGFGSSKLKLEHCSSEKVLEKKRGHSWTAKKPSFLNGKCHHLAYTLRVHLGCVFVTVLSAILRVCIWILETQVGALLVWNVLEKSLCCVPPRKFQSRRKRKLKWETHTSQSVPAGDAPNLIPGP